MNDCIIFSVLAPFSILIKCNGLFDRVTITWNDLGYMYTAESVASNRNSVRYYNANRTIVITDVPTYQRHLCGIELEIPQQV